MEIILFDDPVIRESLLPFTYTRPVGEIRVGIMTIAEKWQKKYQSITSYLTQPYLQNKFPGIVDKQNILINGAVCPDHEFVERIKNLKPGEYLQKNNTLLAFRADKAQVQEISASGNYPQGNTEYEGQPTIISEVWHIFQQNAAQIKTDFSSISKTGVSATITDKFTKIYNPENVFVERGAVIRAAIINAEHGPVYIGKNAEVQEGALIRGPFSLGEGSVVNMGGKMRGDTTVGPYSKVGGEVSNSVIFGYSNKGHDGFIGNTVIGEWCNLGADTNTSNLKNNYDIVKLWNYPKNGFKSTGVQFCGLMMGDHSKCGINTMFNTGTVVGVSANIFGDGFPRNFIPSFAWGGASGFTTFDIKKAFEVAERVMARRSVAFNETEKNILNYIFEKSVLHRVWEKNKV